MPPSSALLPRAHGIAASPDELQAALIDALARYRSVLYPASASALPTAEAELLRQGGFDLSPHPRGKDDPLARSAAEYAAILTTAATVGETAARLGVTEGRIRQRLAQHTLVGVDAGRGWRIPSFQFVADGELPGWAEVAPHLPADLSVVEVLAWLTLPHPDLVVGADEVPVAPRDWLLAGRSPRVVAALAAALE